MKTAMKKALSLSLVLILLLSVFPMAAFATETGEDIAVADAAVTVPVSEDAAATVPAVGETVAEDAADTGIALPSEGDQGFTIPEGDGETEQEPAEVKLDKDKKPGKDEDKRPGKDETQKPGDENTGNQEPAAPTSLTVNFYLDNALAQTATHNAAASVQDLINACCTVDDSQTVYYSGARVDSTPYALADVVALGQEVHIYLTTEAPAADPEPAPTTCKVCGAAVDSGMCTGCYLDSGDCVCKQAAAPEDSHGKVTLTLNYNYKGAKSTKMKVDRNAKISDIIVGIPAPTRDGHLFSNWSMDQAGADLIDEERVTAEGVVIYAQWDDNLAIGGNITIRVNLNYDHKMGEPVTNIAKGTRMGDILDYVSVPSRWNHKFVGWYWDRDCTDDVEAGEKVYRNDEIFAKWEKRKTNNEIMLKIYLNGDTKSVAKIVDMYNYAKDGEISMSEVKEVVKKYYTAKNADGMSFIGLFEADEWSDYVRNHKHHRGSNHIDVNRHDDTTIYVMVHNAKTAPAASSGTPDSSNPKTGDMIMNSVVIMGASAACLAALFFLNKKRAH